MKSVRARNTEAERLQLLCVIGILSEKPRMRIALGLVSLSLSSCIGAGNEIHDVTSVLGSLHLLLERERIGPAAQSNGMKRTRLFVSDTALSNCIVRTSSPTDSAGTFFLISLLKWIGRVSAFLQCCDFVAPFSSTEYINQRRGGRRRVSDAWVWSATNWISLLAVFPINKVQPRKGRGEKKLEKEEHAPITNASGKMEGGI